MKTRHKIVLTAVMLLQAMRCWCLEKGMSPSDIAFGPFDFTPLLNLDESYNDNIFHSKGNKTPTASMVTQINGGGELALRRNLDRYALRYNFLSSQYHSSPADDFVDNTLGLTTHFEGDTRNRIDLTANAVFGHYMRGTFLSQGDIASQISEPDQYHSYNTNINYRYGRSDAPANMGLQIGWTQFNYINHLQRTAANDRTQFDITPSFYLRLMPKVYMSTQVQNTFINYPNTSQINPLNTFDGLQISGRSYSLRRYLLGVTWSQSSKTQGTIRAGYSQQEFYSSVQQPSAGLTWDGQLQWSPLTYSRFNFGMSNAIQPTIGNGASRQVQTYTSTWTHIWPNRVTSSFSGSYQESASQGLSQGTASGTTFLFDVKYQMRPWLNIGVNYLKSNFQADIVTSNSNQQIIMFYVHAQ